MLDRPFDLVLYGGSAVLLLAGLLWMFVRAPRASVTLVLVLTVLEGSREWSVTLGVTTGVLNLGWADLATVLMASAAVHRRARRALVSPSRAGLTGLAGMVLVGLLAWVFAAGFMPSLRFWWVWSFAVAAAFYAASFPELGGPDGLRPFFWAAMLGSASQAIGIALRGFGSNTDTVLVNGELQSARAITSTVAFIMLVGAVVLLLDGRRVTVSKLLLASWLGLSIVIAQHRSVWVAAAVAAFVGARAVVGHARQRLLVGTLITFGVLLGFMAMSAVVRSQQQLSEAATYTGSLEWREQNWNEKLATGRTVLQWLVGAALGPTPLSDRSRLQFQFSSHNMYVETITILGLVGLALLMLVVIGALRASKAGSPERIVVVSLLAFGLFYQWPAAAWMIVGIACSASGRVVHHNAKSKDRTLSQLPPTGIDRGVR